MDKQERKEKTAPNTPHYVSTVFACDTSADNRFIRCDYCQCKDHSINLNNAPEWIPNTPRNVKILDQHVGQQIFQFVSEYESHKEIIDKSLCEMNLHLLENPLLLSKYSKVLVFMNLRDKQAELGLWIHSFLVAASASTEYLNSTICTITTSFSSRLELLNGIKRLRVIRENNEHVEVMVILSCHSSNQGQVFSCTPTYISAGAKFEEFCSLHDFVQTCQDVLGSMLEVVHISSCFTLKLDSSLRDWPVCYTWYRNDLRCTLSGSTREVYETGSQVADLYLMLSLFVNQHQGSLRTCFKTAISKATETDWPDLADEMGLAIINIDSVEAAINMPADEDKVTPASVVFSPLHVILITITNDVEEACQGSQDANREDQLLVDAILQNLHVRKSSDLNAKFTKISLNNNLTDDLIMREVQNGIVEDSSREIFFVLISKRFGKILTQLYEHLRMFCGRNHLKVYGMHVQNVTPMSWRALSLRISDQFSGNPCCVEEYLKNSFPVTGFLSESATCVEKYPLVLYLIHLAVGENGFRRLKKADVTQIDKKIPSKWSLVDVYMETSYVLSGLGKKCDVKLISPKTLSIRCLNRSEYLNKQTLNQPCQPHQRPIGENLENAVENTTSTSTITSMIPCDSENCESTSNFEIYADKVLSKKQIGRTALKRKGDDCDADFEPSLKIQELGDYNFDVGNNGKLITESNICVRGLKASYASAENRRLDLDPQAGFREDFTIPIAKQCRMPDDDCCSIEGDVARSSNGTFENTSDCVDESNRKERLQSTKAVHSHSELKHSKILTSLESDWNHSKDLPLMANVDDVLVKHYILDLSVDFEAKVISGTIVFFIEPARPDVNELNFQMCLDSTMVNVESAVEIPVPDDLEIHFHDKKCCCSLSEREEQLKQENIYDSCSSSDANCLHKSTSAENISSASENDTSCTSAPDISSMVKEKSSDDVIKKGSKQFNKREATVCQVPEKDINDSAKPKVLGTGNLIEKNALESNKNTCEDIDGRCNEAVDSKKLSCKHCRFLQSLKESKQNNNPLKFKKLAYSIHGWCIRIWKEGDDANAWPRCVKLWYHTSPEGQSIMWAKDQDGNNAVFTPGAYINNRSLMPCQEPPVAMSTWQAYFHVKNGETVLMSGDHCVCKESLFRELYNEPGLFYYEMSMPLPCSTLALAVGNFVRSPVTVEVKAGSSGKVVPVTMYAPSSHIKSFVDEFLELSCAYLTAASELLGEYPFSRLDLVLMPRCFACMGLESPNLAFLSQSLMCGDRSMAVRIAHEIAHAWFGLLVGVKDWTEEWLSEGFATYMEERIQARAEQLSYEEDIDRVRLRQAVRCRSLKSELLEAEEHLKSLRPRPISSGYVSAAEAIRRSIADNDDNNDEPAPHSLLRGALIPSRKWTQVHYLKGYFLLYHLSLLVGQEKFDRFLWTYVNKYRECLVSSEMFFNMFADEFKISTEKKQQIMNDWLEAVGMPPDVERMFSDTPGRYILHVNEKFTEWKKHDAKNKRCQTLKQKRKNVSLDHMNHPSLIADEIILLLENLLERDAIAHRTLKDLQLVYSLNSCNAEIRHRWCELIVKHKYNKEYNQVRRFLIEDQGMGIYLFGELLISEDRTQKRIADEVYVEIEEEMDGCTHQTVYEMLNGI